MKSVAGFFNIEINVTCPHCSEYINILDVKKVPELNGGYEFLEIILFTSNFFVGCDNLDEIVRCHKCKKQFAIGKVTW